MSNCKVRVLKPGEIEFTLEATFTLNEWKKITADLEHKWQWPMSELADAIRDCTSQAEKVFMPVTVSIK